MGRHRAEGGALLLALLATRVKDDLLYLSDNKPVLTDVNKWVGEGSKATLANAPNSDATDPMCFAYMICSPSQLLR